MLPVLEERGYPRTSTVAKILNGSALDAGYIPFWHYFLSLLVLTSNQLPTGPEYLDLESLEKGHNGHIVMMHGSDSWLHSSLSSVKRFFDY